MRFENKEIMETWMEKYTLAKVYFEHYDNLEIPKTFKIASQTPPKVRVIIFWFWRLSGVCS